MFESDDLTDPEIIDRPFEYFGHLRETDPVYKNEKFGGWIVTRYNDVQQCLQDDTHLSVEVEADRLRNSSRDIPATTEMFPKWIIYLDPPDHTKLRRIISEAFNPEMVQNQESIVEQITESLITDIEERDPDVVEFIDEFAFQLPIRVIGEIMGLDSEDADMIGGWSENIALTLFHYYQGENRYQKTEASIKAFSEYLHELVDRRKENPKDDLLTYLLEAESDGESLDDDEVVATAVLLLFAGHETTTKLLANGTIEFIRHPEQLELLRSDPSLAPKAVEEVLRYHGPSKSLTRGVIEPFELREKQIEPGDRLLLSQAAANRDPRQYDNPEEFDITRGTSTHLGFGHGTHHCLGAPLARLEARTAFPAIVQAFPNMQLATESVEWTKSPLVRGPEELRLRMN